MRIALTILFISLSFNLVRAQSLNKGTPMVEASMIEELAIYHPISDLGIIGKGMEREHSDSVSRISEQLWLDILQSNQHRLPKAKVRGFDFIADRDVFEIEIENLMIMASSGEPFERIKVPPYLYTLLEKDDSRYVMLSYLTGFTRKKGNLTGEVLKAVGIGVLTMDMYTPNVVSHESDILVLIMDKELGHAVFYRRSLALESHPLKTKKLQRQFKQLFKGYFEESV